jgi:hypothetical protein
MAHKCGFTLKALLGTLKANGFKAIAGGRREGPAFDLWALASKEAMSDEEIRKLAARMLPEGPFVAPSSAARDTAVGR